ncbi:RNA 2',3'-cyclic phosphodiesterase [Sphingobium scionense]
MHRLFVAIRPPATIRSQLLAQMAGIPGARWQDDGQLHLTLRFIGEVDRHQADDIADALAGVRFQPFAIALAGAGYFDRRGVVDTLWAGCSHAIRSPIFMPRWIAPACPGIPVETRAYLPHITLARFSRYGGDIAPFLALHAGLASPAFTVDEFNLYESRLGHAGSSYHVVETYRAEGHPDARDD